MKTLGAMRATKAIESRLAAHGRVERVGEDVDLPGLGVVGVPGWKSVGSPSARSTTPTLGMRGIASWLKACSSPTGVTVTSPTANSSPCRVGTAASPSAPQLVGRERVGVHRGAGVGPDEPRRALGVEVVGVVVRHDDRVETGQLLEARREVAGVDEDAAIGRLDEQAGMSEVSHAHGST